MRQWKCDCCGKVVKRIPHSGCACGSDVFNRVATKRERRNARKDTWTYQFARQGVHFTREQWDEIAQGNSAAALVAATELARLDKHEPRGYNSGGTKRKIVQELLGKE